MDRLNQIVVQKLAGATLECWQRAILVGNRAFDDRDFDTARRVYLYALSVAQGLIAQLHLADESVAALVVTHHNLADLHLRLGQVGQACDQLCAVHYQLLRLSVQPQGVLAGAARRHLRQTRLELQQFLSTAPDAELADLAWQALQAQAPVLRLH
jgi:hypothetical protein